MSDFRVYIDVETNGFCPIRNDIVSIAAVVSDDEFNLKDELYDTCKPEFNKFYSDDAEEIHGFSRSQLESFQSQRILCIKILDFLKYYKNRDNFPQLFVSHSLRGFDYNFLEWLFRKNDLHFSLWKVLRQDHQRSTILEGRKAGYKTNKLDTWAERVGFNLKHHDALSDTYCCYEVDKYLMESNENTSTNLLYKQERKSGLL